MKTPFNKDEMLDELRGILVNLASCLGHVYGRDNAFNMLAIPEGKCDGFEDDRLDCMDISKMPVTVSMCELYDYAFQGIDVGIQWDVIELDCYAFFLGLEKFYPLDLENSNLMSLSLYKCMHTLDLAAARATLSNDDLGGGMLDFGILLTGGAATPAGMIPLRHMALLAGLDEKTVRNLAGPKSKQPLATISVANRTYVDIGVAKEWLRARGALVDTVVVPKNMVRDLSLTGFTSLEDMNTFLADQTARVTSLEIKPSTLSDEDAQQIAHLKSGNLSHDMTFYVRLARAIRVDPVTFADAVLKLFQSLQLEQMRTQLRHALEHTSVQA